MDAYRDGVYRGLFDFSSSSEDSSNSEEEDNDLGPDEVRPSDGGDEADDQEEASPALTTLLAPQLLPAAGPPPAKGRGDTVGAECLLCLCLMTQLCLILLAFKQRVVFPGRVFIRSEPRRYHVAGHQVI
ncbi:hypothetical protein F5882DRAFT_387702 [Hyaloscypha sp. PMI_1271]|nr:hypothetical protein F5882DRAFT_387702 [Hyaloscypha sp. PMI_1271]